MHIEVISASATQPNTGAAATAFTGDSLTIRNSRAGKAIRILALWTTKQVAGFCQIAFPTGHDTTRGYRAGDAVGVNPIQIPLGMALEPMPQELLSLTIAGSNTAGDVEQASMLIQYDDMPGMEARLLTAAEVIRRTEKLTTVETSITSTAGPGYSGEVAINSGSDLLIANRDYAVLGISSRTAVHANTIKGPDMANVRLAVPGVLRDELTSSWFMMLSRATGEKTVPVFNSGNKTSTLVGCATDENAGTFIQTVYLALLKK
jgi:hypothetical protein